jgi:hypothetical protein
MEAARAGTAEPARRAPEEDAPELGTKEPGCYLPILHGYRKLSIIIAIHQIEFKYDGIRREYRALRADSLSAGDPNAPGHAVRDEITRVEIPHGGR